MPRIPFRGETDTSRIVWVSVIGGLIGSSLATSLVLVANTVTNENWNAVSAVATTLATIVAACAAAIAVLLPQRQRAEDRSEATAEILKSTAHAIAIFEEASDHFELATKNAKLQSFAAKAEFNHIALDRLLSRPSLTDGAIVTGAAGMKLLMGVMQQERSLKLIDKRPTIVEIDDHINPLKPIVDEARKRAVRVASYAVKRRWPGWKRRFLRVSTEGLDVLNDDETTA